MIHPRIPKTLVVVLLMHAGVLMPIQLGLIASRPTVEEPLEIQVHIIPAVPEPIKQPGPLKQQPVKQEAPKSVNIIRPAVQPKSMPMSMLTLMLPPSDNAPAMSAALPVSPAPAPEQAPAPAPVSLGPINVGINDTQCSEPPFVCPSMSQKMGEEGRAMIKIPIDTAGEVTNVAVMSSSGSPRLDRVAADVTRVIKCSLYRQNGRAVPVVVSEPFVFKLDN